jgi:heavy metal sensor kinase
MSSGRIRPLGLRARLTLWTTLVLAASLAAVFAWVHHGLRAVLEARNDAFLEQMAAELRAVSGDARSGGGPALEAEVRREVDAYRDDGLVVAVRTPGRLFVAPSTPEGLLFADRLGGAAPGGPGTIRVAGDGGRYRVIRRELATPEGGCIVDLGLSLRETDATLAQFDGRVATGGLVFLASAVAGGVFLSRQALRPVARSIRTARALNPANLSARLPRTGADDEIDQLAGTINDLLDRLADNHAQVIRFTADASHELRSPLAAMRAAVEVALQRPRAAEAYREALASLGEQCDRLTGLVNGLLLLARADAGEVDLRREPVDLAGLAAEVAEMFEPLAEERGVRLALDAPPAPPVVGDAPRLRQLVTNLVDNAIKFTGPGGAVTLRLEGRPGWAELSVSDTGIGVAEHQLPHIFERFYRASPSRSGEGYGLGLSICRWIAEAHGGSIAAAGGPGGGTTVSVRLPAPPGGPMGTGGENPPPKQKG